MVNDKQMQEIYESAFIHVNFSHFNFNHFNFSHFKQRHHQ